MPSGVSWHLSSKIAVLPNKFSFPQTVQPKWAHTAYLTPVKRRVKDFSKPRIEGERRQTQRGRGEQEQGRGQGDGLCAKQEQLFLGGPVDFYLHLSISCQKVGKEGKRTTPHRICWGKIWLNIWNMKIVQTTFILTFCHLGGGGGGGGSPVCSVWCLLLFLVKKGRTSSREIWSAFDSMTKAPLPSQLEQDSVTGKGKWRSDFINSVLIWRSA